MPKKLSPLFRSSAEHGNCAELRKRASDYLEANISEEEREHIRMHLERCGNCNRFLETLRTTISMLRDLSSHAVPESLKDKLRQLPQEEAHG